MLLHYLCAGVVTSGNSLDYTAEDIAPFDCQLLCTALPVAGVVTSGNSLDYTAEDMARMVQHEAAVKVRTLCLLCMLCPLCLLHHQSCFAWIVLSLSPPSETPALHCAPLHPPLSQEMEAAAVAWSADLFGCPVFCIKSVTDIVDGERPAQVGAGRSMRQLGGGPCASDVVALQGCACCFNHNFLPGRGRPLHTLAPCSFLLPAGGVP